jgi:hypothetical protein
MTGSLRLFLCTALLASLSACGDDSGDSSDGGTPSGGGTSIDELPALYSQAICEAYENCFGPLFDVYLQGEDCLTRTTTRLEDELPRFKEAIDEGRLAYDGRKVETCTDEVRALDCEDLLNRESATCQAVFDGTLALGDYCAMDEECQGSSYCKFEDSCPGTCAKLELEGGGCSSDSSCESGLSCSNETGRCVVPAGPGDRCNQGEPECAPGYLCAGANDDQNLSGNCRTFEEVFAAAEGESCDPLTTKLCAQGLVCRIDGITAMGEIEAVCAEGVEAGAACNLALPDACPDGQYCDIPANTLTGTCKARPGIGQPCGKSPFDMTGTICEEYARCDGATCRALGHLGDGCSSDASCYSDHCVGGKCVASEGCE